MFNTAKVDYLLCGSLEDEEKAAKQTKKNRENGSLIMCGGGRGGREGHVQTGCFLCQWLS